MADEINFEVTGFGQLRQQLKEAQLEMIKLAAAGKEGTAEFIAAAQKAGQLKEAIKDASDAANVFTTEGKFQAVTKSLAAVSGGFTAIQGAIGLVSDDTKAFEETFKKLQSAMALTQGLTALSEMGDAFKNLKSVAVGTFNSIKAAIGASGIGLLVVAIAALAAGFKALYDSVQKTNKELVFTEDELKQIGDSSGKAIAKVEILTARVKDQTLSEKERTKALKKLQEEYPNYFNNLGNDINNTRALTTAKDKLAEALVREAKVRALQERLGAVYSESAQEEITLTQKLARNKENQARISARLAKEVANDEIGNANASRQSLKVINQNIAEISGRLKEINDERSAQSKTILDLINKEEVAVTKLGGSTEKSTEKVVTAEKAKVKSKKEVLQEQLAEIDNETKFAIEKNKLLEQEAIATAKTEQEKIDLKEQYAKQEIDLTEQGEKKKRELIQGTTTTVKEDQKELQEFKDASEVEITRKLEIEELKRRVLAAQTTEERLKLQKELDAKLAEDRKQFNENAKSSAKKEFDDRKSEIDTLYKAKELAIRQEEISEEEKQKKLDALEVDRLEKQKINAEDYVLTVEGADAEVVDLALQLQKKLEEIEEKKRAADKKTQDDKIKNFKEYADVAINLAQGITDAVAAKNDAEKQMELERVKESKQSEEEKAKAIDAINKKYFEKDKQVQIANSIISTLAGALNAFMSTLKVDPTGITGSILAAAALAAGYFQVEKIRATTYQSNIPSGSTEGAKPTGSRYAEGGVLGGPTHDMGGIRTAFGELEGGEFVVNRRATANFLPLLEMINAQGNIAGPEMPRSAYQPVIKTYVLATEVTSAQEANAKIAGLARLT